MAPRWRARYKFAISRRVALALIARIPRSLSWRENPNHWRAITRREACVPVRIRAVESLRSRSNPRHLTEPDYDPKRRARLAYACCGVRNLLCDVLGVISAWGLKMIKRLDRVKLTARAAAAFNNNKRPSMFDWTARRGVVERITANKANAVVLWDGRKSMDVVPIRSVELEPELGLPPTEHWLWTGTTYSFGFRCFGLSPYAVWWFGCCYPFDCWR